MINKKIRIIFRIETDTLFAAFYLKYKNPERRSYCYLYLPTGSIRKEITVYEQRSNYL